MKIHRPICEVIITALEQIFVEKYYADKVVNILLKGNKKFGSRDRRFVAETVYDIVRWWRFLTFAVGREDNYWLLLGAYLVWKKIDLPPWPEFKGVPRLPEISKLPRAVRESVPDWLDEVGAEELGARWDGVLPALNRPAEVILRVNTLKGDIANTKKKLALEEVEVDDLGSGALRLKNRTNLFLTKSYQSGLFEIQDWSSQQVGPFLDVQPGMRVVDACAGAGGKSLHLAALMKNKGKILALDVSQKKLDELKQRARRAGVDIIETRLIEGTKTIKRLEKSADRLLLDVPCSGLGVLRRKPDSKWKMTKERLEELRTLQSTILSQYPRILKAGGELVYSTCSILPSENQKQIEKLVANSVNFKLVADKTFYPDSDGFDGFYMAKLTSGN